MKRYPNPTASTMDDEPQNLAPICERYLQKVSCSVCDATGAVRSDQSSKAVCSECSGVGWILGKANEPMVCPTCKGLKSINLLERMNCAVCQGNGFLVRLLQDYRAKSVCSRCEGTGSIKCQNCEGTGYWNCPICDGSGISDGPDWRASNYWWVSCTKCAGIGRSITQDPLTISCRAWEKSELRATIEARFGSDWYSDMNENDKLLLDRSEYVSVVRCKRCRASKSTESCFLCNNKKVIAFNFYGEVKCGECDGTGSIKIPTWCSGCQGEKQFLCIDCKRENENFDCPDCTGTGFIEETVTKEV